jgi:hypothetical protein
MMMIENLVEWRLAGETEVLGENPPQRHFVNHKSHLPDPGSNPGRRGGKPATNRLSYGAAKAVRSKAWTIFARSDSGIVGSYPTQGMDVCVYSVCVR